MYVLQLRKKYEYFHITDYRDNTSVTTIWMYPITSSGGLEKIRNRFCTFLFELGFLYTPCAIIYRRGFSPETTGERAHTYYEREMIPARCDMIMLFDNMKYFPEAFHPIYTYIYHVRESDGKMWKKRWGSSGHGYTPAEDWLAGLPFSGWMNSLFANKPVGIDDWWIKELEETKTCYKLNGNIYVCFLCCGDPYTSWADYNWRFMTIGEDNWLLDGFN